MEIEAKLTAASPDVLYTVGSLGKVGPYRVRGVSEHRIQDIYFDTPRRTLSKQGATLRLRRMDGTYYATFKALNRTAGTVHCREEVEEQLPGRRAFHDRSRLPLPCQRALELVGNEPLRATLIVRNRRRVLHLAGEEGGGFLVLLDDVIFAGRGGRKAFYEIEIEGEKEEDRAALEDIALWLRAHFPLAPSGPSKFATGLALLGHT